MALCIYDCRPQWKCTHQRREEVNVSSPKKNPIRIRKKQTEPLPEPKTRWKVIYDNSYYVVYVFIHDEAGNDEKPDEQDKVMEWAKRAINLVGLFDGVFLTVEIPNGTINGIAGCGDKEDKDGNRIPIEFDLRGIIAIQGSGGPQPTKEHMERYKKFKVDHVRLGREELGIEFEVKAPGAEFTRSLAWMSELRNRYRIIC